MSKKLLRLLWCAVCVLGLVVLTAPTAAASGLLDDTSFPIQNYDIATYIDTSGFFGNVRAVPAIILNALMNMFFSISVMLGSLTGYVVRESFRLDFVGDAADQIGQSVQRLIGVGSGGIGGTGFLPALMLFAVVTTGLYLMYLVVVKKETTRVLSTALRFVFVFAAVVGLTMNAPAVLRNLNDFSIGLSEVALDTGVSFASPLGGASEGDSVAGLENMVHDIQIRQPWLLLHFGTTSIDSLENGHERVYALLSSAEMPGAVRDMVLQRELNVYGNTNVTNVTSRLGMVFLLFFVNLALSFFIIMLALLMVLSQLLLILYFFLFLLSMVFSLIPGFQSAAKRGMDKFINALLMRLGYTLIIVLAFSLSTLVYSIADGRAFLFVALLQILVFAGIYKSQDDILGLLRIDSGENHRFARGVGQPFRRGRRSVMRTIGKVGAGFKLGRASRRRNETPGSPAPSGSQTASRPQEKQSFGGRVGSTIGKVRDIPSSVADNVGYTKDRVKSMPVRVRHRAAANVGAFKDGVANTSGARHAERAANRAAFNASVDARRQQRDEVMRESVPQGTSPDLKPNPTRKERRAERRAANTVDQPTARPDRVPRPPRERR
ncbi:MAG: hypothetical protein FWE08_06960 [Oscillospiraceae bacterium]|nr:hypothetical protein [Oscillospiraceae bacterium]